MKIAIAATFTAEPLQDSLAFWNHKLQWQAELAFASYNQVFQELLDPASLLSTNKAGINVVLVGPEDWQAREAHGQTQATSTICESAKEFVRAVQGVTQHSATPHLICLCPASPQKAADLEVVEAEELISN